MLSLGDLEIGFHSECDGVIGRFFGGASLDSIYIFKRLFRSCVRKMGCKSAEVEAGRTVRDSGGLDQGTMRIGQIPANLKWVADDECGGSK